jgi:hypothetical protein
VNFLMCSFANHDSLHPGISLSNTSFCSSKYLDTMDICSTCGNEHNEINVNLEL